MCGGVRTRADQKKHFQHLFKTPSENELQRQSRSAKKFQQPHRQSRSTTNFQHLFKTVRTKLIYIARADQQKKFNTSSKHFHDMDHTARADQKKHKFWKRQPQPCVHFYVKTKIPRPPRSQLYLHKLG